MILLVLDLIQILGLTGCFPRVGESCIWVRLFTPNRSASPCCISLSGPDAVCVFHLMSGQLKSPVNVMFVMLWFSIFSGDLLSSSRCFCSLCGI
jgi:hypothetical protein